MLTSEKTIQKLSKKFFTLQVRVAKDFELIGGNLLAGDGTRVRAQNSKKNNFNLSKIERHITYIDRKLEEYNNLLSTVEHPFGVLKREWGFDHIMTMKRASADVGLIFSAYNLRRIFNLIDKNELQSYWKALSLYFHLKMNS